jgi:hypothetical protein
MRLAKRVVILSEALAKQGVVEGSAFVPASQIILSLLQIDQIEQRFTRE